MTRQVTAASTFLLDEPAAASEIIRSSTPPSRKTLPFTWK